jgi:hypothetical protein
LSCFALSCLVCRTDLFYIKCAASRRSRLWACGRRQGAVLGPDGGSD